MSCVFFPLRSSLFIARAFPVLALLVSLSSLGLGCTPHDADKSGPTAGADKTEERDGSTANVCQPKCEADACGADDGCGSTCGCPGRGMCVEGACLADECGGICADQEVCVAGSCICEPNCDSGQADDGCGGTCDCPSGQVRGASGACATVAACVDTCETAGSSCGEVCGESCGSCDDGSTCRRGACVCQPQCDGTSCDDGCGGLCECATGTVCNGKSACVAPDACADSCDSTARVCGEMCGESCGGCDDGDACLGGACIPARNCEGCSLAVYVLNSESSNGRIKQAQLAIDYNPVEGEPRPRLADFRIWADHEVTLDSVEAGLALRRAKKRLYSDGVTGKSFRKRADDSFQMLVYGSGTVDKFEPGRVVTLTFSADTLGPIRFYLQRRLQVFAPASADAVLQSSDYDHMVVVSR